MSFLPPALNFRFFLLSEANSHLQSRLPAGEVRARVKSSELPLSTATDFGDCSRSLGWFFISLGDKHSLSSSEATQVPIGRHQHTRPIGLLLLASFVVRLLVSHHEQFVAIAHPMNRPVRDEELFMEEALAAIRRGITDEQAGEMAFAGTEPATFGEDASPQPTNNAGLLSRKATAAVGSAFNRLSETARKHEPTLEDVVRETLRPMLKSWLDENLPHVVERMVQEEIERVTRGR